MGGLTSPSNVIDVEVASWRGILAPFVILAPFGPVAALAVSATSRASFLCRSVSSDRISLSTAGLGSFCSPA